MEEKTVLYEGNIDVNYKYEIVNEKSSFVICGYFWGKNNVNRNNKDGLTYGQLADRLINYCKKNKTNYYLAEIPQFAKPGGYQQAINFKPTFILETLPIIYPRKAAVMDTDMTVLKYPSLFDMDYDFMGFNWLYETHQVFPELDMSCFDPYVLHTSGGMLVFNQTTPSIKLLKAWKDITDKNPGKAEDRMLSIPFNKNFMITEMRCLWLPLMYFYIPYFFQMEDVFEINRKFRKAFKHIKDFNKEHTFGEFFNIKLNKDVYIHHPEELTSEEQAALQGASSDRVPQEFYIETGRKLKCLNEEKGLVNMPELYCDTKSDIKAFSFDNKLIDLYGFAKLNNKKLSIKYKGKYKVLAKSIVVDKSNKSNHDNKYYDTYVKECGNKLFDNLLVVLSDFNLSQFYKCFAGPQNNISYVLVDRKECNKSYLIYSLMKKYKKNVLFLENQVGDNIGNSVKDMIDNVMYQMNDICETYDFACINTNEDPDGFKRYSKKCYDPKSLSVLTTDVLFFGNNKFGLNLLKLWNNEEKKRVDNNDRYNLSRAYNKHMYAIYSRCKWLDGLRLGFRRLNDKVNLYDYFKQCADRRPVKESGGINPYNVHYVTGKYKK